MRNLLIIISVLLLSGINLYSQWSTDPNNNLIIGYGLNPELCSDSTGGCYVTYEYDNLSYPRKLAIERLDKYGYKPWGTLKQILGELPQQWQAEIVEDGEGGVIVSYEDNEWIPPSNFTTRVRVQKLDSVGNFLWGQTGVRVSLNEANQGGQALVADGEGGCVVVWQNYDGIWWINRISSLGQREWGDLGFAIGAGNSMWIIRASDGNYYVQTGLTIRRINQAGQILNQYSVTLGYPVPDPEGGLVTSGRVWTGMIPKLVAQRNDSLGNNLWQEPYVEIADSLHINTQLRFQNNGNYFYFGWSGRKEGIDQVAQFQSLRLDGSILFDNGSIALMNRQSSLNSIVPSELARTIFIYWNHPNLPDSTLAQVYDTLGNKIWDEDGVLVSHPAIVSQSFMPDGRSGFIIGGTINDFTIVAQQVSKNGNLGEIIPVPVELISFSAFVDKDKIIINWITATELNNYGFDIERKATLNPAKGEAFENWESIGFVSGYGTTTETQSYSFTDENVTKGIYKYRLKQIDFDGSFTYSNEIEVEVDYNPKVFVLYQNYPNPLNSSTIIKYQIPKHDRVKINLYNILGEKILTLFEGEQETGEHQVILSTGKLPSGNYFYCLETTSTKQIKKLTIIK